MHDKPNDPNTVVLEHGRSQISTPTTTTLSSNSRQNVGDNTRTQLALPAVRKGDLAALKSVLEVPDNNGAQVDDGALAHIADEQGATLAHHAARAGQLDVLRYLIERSPDLARRRSRVGASCLHDAAVTGQLTCIRWLVDEMDCDPEDADELGNCPVHLATRFGQLGLLKWLVSEKAVNIKRKTGAGALPLHFAAARGSLDTVKYLVEQKPGSVNAQLENGATAAYLASQGGHLETLRYLVEEGGATVRLLAHDGMSCVHAAAQMGHLDCVQWLVTRHGLQVNDKDCEGATPLHVAASRGHVGLVTWLLDNGARMSADALGGTPLHDAAEHGQLQIVRLLIQRGYDSTVRDHEGLTPGRLAELFWRAECAATLKDREDVTDTMSTYQTAFYSNSAERSRNMRGTSPMEEPMDISSSTSSGPRSPMSERAYHTPQQLAQSTGDLRSLQPLAPSLSHLEPVQARATLALSTTGSQTEHTFPPEIQNKHHAGITEAGTNTSPRLLKGVESSFFGPDEVLPSPSEVSSPPAPAPPPPPPPPPAPPAPPLPAFSDMGTGSWRRIQNHIRESKQNGAPPPGAITKSTSSGGLSISGSSLASNQVSPSQSMDLLAELKAANGMASLKRTKKPEQAPNNSKYFGAQPPAGGAVGAGEGGDPEKAESTTGSVRSFKELVNSTKEPKPKTLVKAPSPNEKKVVPGEEYDPKRFLEQVQDTDTTGKQIPAWKRLLIARQLAEKAQRDAVIQKQKDEEEARFRKMPPWKRAMVAKREAEAKSIVEEVVPDRDLPSPPPAEQAQVCLDDDGLPAAPWQRARLKLTARAN